jgi:hypothetical protein
MHLGHKMTVDFKSLAHGALFAASCLLGSQANAQSYLSPGYIMGEIGKGLGVVKPEPAPDFVVRGRPDPASLEYTALKPPPRGLHSAENKPGSKLEGEAKAIAELEAARANSQARAAGGSSAKSSAKSVTPPPEEDPVPMKWNAWDTE